MILPDLNLLLYAYNPHAAQHRAAEEWWGAVMSDEELIGLPNEITLGFIRLATHPRLGKAAVPLSAARETVEFWLALPHARILLPKQDHIHKVMDLMRRSESRGAMASDASLAIYAMENRATLCSNDADFSRFPGLDWRNPMQAK